MALLDSKSDSKPKTLNRKRKFDKINKKTHNSKKPKFSEEKHETESQETIENLVKAPLKSKETVSLSPEQIAERYPILNDTELVKKFLGVPMTNNQKGRVRQMLRDSLKGTRDNILPDVIYSKIQSIVKTDKELTEAELRKIRILYNMLKTAADIGVPKKKVIKKEKAKKTKDTDKVDLSNDNTDNKKEEEGETDKSKDDVDGQITKNVADKKEQKVKGPKRYVVFVGNLPPNIEKEKILEHFSNLNNHIVDVRLPPRGEGKKSSIAYVELKDEYSYELALSKHHSMMDNKRINVLYTTQKNSKISKGEAKSTSAKLVALQKSGKLIGSIPVNRKRSHRRNKAKRARAKAEAES
ncbi:unnamed protein product [Leptosia nina]|uniref:RRM domain-containing protein n=1 Tax=Leptosia nina TaxID=320188 RepID=A0AAV1JHZ0_9NEOP